MNFCFPPVFVVLFVVLDIFFWKTTGLSHFRDKETGSKFSVRQILKFLDHISSNGFFYLEKTSFIKNKWHFELCFFFTFLFQNLQKIFFSNSINANGFPTMTLPVLTKMRILNMSPNNMLILVRLVNNSGPIMHMEFSNNLLFLSGIAPKLIYLSNIDLFFGEGLCCPVFNRKTYSGLRLFSEAPHKNINDEISLFNFIATFLTTLNSIVLKKFK